MTGIVKWTDVGKKSAEMLDGAGFFKRLGIIFCTALLLPVGGLALAYRLGETIDVAIPARRQAAGENLLYLPRFVNRQFDYKILRIADVKPEVLVLGSSRINQFREEMFAPYKFYNAGNTIWTLEEAQLFVSAIPPNAVPRVLLFNVDALMFQQGARGQDVVDRYSEGRWPGIKRSISDQIFAMREMVRFLFRHPRFCPNPNQDRYSQRTALGMLACVGHGFRNDGSIQNSAAVGQTEVALIAKTQKMFASWVREFDARRAIANKPQSALRPDPKKWAVLGKLVEAAKRRGIDQVILFTAPFAPEFYRHFLEDPIEAALERSFFSDEGRQKLAELGVPYVDASRVLFDEDLNDEMIDFSHSGERAHMRMLVALLDNPGVARALPLLDRLSVQRAILAMNRFRNWP
jgi:hypothetical protein